MNRFTPFEAQFCEYYDYPAEAVEAFRTLFERLDQEDNAGSRFETIRKRFMMHQATVYDLLPELHTLADGDHGLCILAFHDRRSSGKISVHRDG